MSNVEGWAFAAPEVREQSKSAFMDALDKLGIERQVMNGAGGMVFTNELVNALGALRSGHADGYAHFVVRLDPQTEDLTDQQKLLIADNGNGCFGGVVNGLAVKVYTD